ncbi:cytochrome-ba3 oxidase subunit [Halorientalis halophila]|uniref:cytochrome-ba3 oxidase subunit n=1 Tax=Halorientalis halophila TaxID=3108499 RepID=UPI0030080373
MKQVIDALSPRRLVAIGLLALVPVLTFGFTRTYYVAAAVTVTNVALITTSLYLLFSPIAPDDDGAGAAHG